MKLLTEKCLGDTKFLCGDTVTQYDMEVAGFFCNMVLNPNSKMVGVKETYDAHAPDRLKTYVTDFQTDMKDYLDKRAIDHPDNTM